MEGCGMKRKINRWYHQHSVWWAPKGEDEDEGISDLVGNKRGGGKKKKKDRREGWRSGDIERWCRLPPLLLLLLFTACRRRAVVLLFLLLHCSFLDVEAVCYNPWPTDPSWSAGSTRVELNHFASFYSSHPSFTWEPGQFSDGREGIFPVKWIGIPSGDLCYYKETGTQSSHANAPSLSWNFFFRSFPIDFLTVWLPLPKGGAVKKVV